VPFVIVAVEAAEATLRQRVAARSREGVDASEATLAVLERQLRDLEPLGSDERAHAVVVDGSLPADDPRVIVALAAVASARTAMLPP
jgi:predicted kinase